MNGYSFQNAWLSGKPSLTATQLKELGIHPSFRYHNGSLYIAGVYIRTQYIQDGYWHDDEYDEDDAAGYCDYNSFYEGKAKWLKESELAKIPTEKQWEEWNPELQEGCEEEAA